MLSVAQDFRLPNRANCFRFAHPAEATLEPWGFEPWLAALLARAWKVVEGLSCMLGGPHCGRQGCFVGVWGSFGEASGRSWGFFWGAQGNSGEPWGALGGVWGGPGRIQGGREGLGAALGGPPGRHGRRWWSLGGSLGSLWGSPRCSGGPLAGLFWGVFAAFGSICELPGVPRSVSRALGKR